MRTSTTITSGNLKGTYRLPDLPNGRYTVTTTAAGYLTQTQPIEISRAGHGADPHRADLGHRDGHGRRHRRAVRRQDRQARVTAGLRAGHGAGIALTSDTKTYKITTGDAAAS